MPRYHVYYARRPTSLPNGDSGIPHLAADALPSSHVHLCEVEAASLNDAFWKMQGETWSPHGEGCELLQSLGLTHASMTIGDVLLDEEGTYWECLDLGWRPVRGSAKGNVNHDQE